MRMFLAFVFFFLISNVLGAAIPKTHQVDSPQVKAKEVSTQGVKEQDKLSKRELVDGIVLKVAGSELILHSDVASAAKELKRRDVPEELLYPAKHTAPSEEKALQLLTNQRLVEQACQENNLKANEEQLDEQIRAVVKGNPNLETQGDLERALGLDGKSIEGFRKEIAAQICLRNFRQRFVVPYVKVTEADLKPYYFLKTGEKAESVSVSVKKIEVSCDGKNSELKKEDVCQESKNKVEKIHGELLAGLDFEKAAERYSQKASVVKVEEYDLNSLASDEIREALESLREGSFTEPVKGGSSWYIFKVFSRKSSLAFGFDPKVLKQEYVAEKSFEEMVGQLEKLRIKHHLKTIP